MREPRFFPDPDLDKVVAMVMDLCAQLHVERQHRLVLEEALARRALVSQEELEALAADPDVRSRSRAAVDQSLGALLACLLERDDAAVPLRPRSPVPEVAR